MHYASRDGRKTSPSGPARRHVPHFPPPGDPPAKNARRKDSGFSMDQLPLFKSLDVPIADGETTGISGQKCFDSSSSQRLCTSLGSRLEALLRGSGSPEYKLTWKHWDIPSGLRISALRGSALRTFVNGPSGWPTSSTTDYKTVSQPGQRRGQLGEAAHLAGWVTPTATDASRGSKPPRPHDTGVPLSQQVAGWATPNACERGPETQESKAKRPESGGIDLQSQAILTAWQTPNAMDGGQTSRGGFRKNELLLGGEAKSAAPWATPAAQEPGGTMEQHLARKDKAIRSGVQMGSAVTALSLQATGATLPSSPVEIQKEGRSTGALNPALSLWLQGYPSDWLTVAPVKESRGAKS